MTSEEAFAILGPEGRARAKADAEKAPPITDEQWAVIGPILMAAEPHSNAA